MSSIIEGYNYDIFISYRQKDNKGDHWVSEFVEALKTELESTFKEEISVYFDINPHDGLLETHDVSESLKEKLKCLIFIPIISRTYCDPKSFAWEHEFKAFVEMASKDQFGLKLKLPNGNVASRVLPVKIYDLDQADIKECDAVLGSVLRGIEFIYKESGVNRPLMPDEAHPDNNSNKTIYRNQINKVANSIKDIIASLKGHHNTVFKDEPVKYANTQQITSKKIFIGLLFLLILGTGVTLIFLKLNKPRISTKDPVAHELYERGKADFDRYIRTSNRVILKSAESFFRKALMRDSLFAEAYVGLASVTYQKPVFENIAETDYLDSVMIFCKQAIKINRHISDAYVYMGYYYMALNDTLKSKEQFDEALKKDHENILAFYSLGLLYQETDPFKSIINFQKAISLDNGNYRSRIFRNLASVYVIAGFKDKAKEIFEEVYKLDNDNGHLNYSLAVNEWSAGNYTESINYALKGYEKDSTNYNFCSWVAFTYFLSGDFVNAMKFYEMMIRYTASYGINSNDLFWSLHRIGLCYKQAGMKEKADSCLNKMIEGLNNLKDLDRYTGYINRPYYDLAGAYAVRGDKEQALQNLKLYFVDQPFINSEFLNLLKKDPLLNNVRESEEYEKLVNEVDQKFKIKYEQIRKWLEDNNLL